MTHCCAARNPAPEDARRSAIRPIRRTAAGFAALLLSLACATPDTNPVASEVARDRFARHRVQDALRFRADGNLEAAERSLRRALTLAPEDPRVHRLLAIVLTDLGRDADAAQHRAEADRIDPPPPLPPDTPWIESARGLLVVWVAPDPDDRTRHERERGDDVAEFLNQRLRTRLPNVEIIRLEPTSVREARLELQRRSPRAVLSLQVKRAYCGDSRKDGPFAVAWLRRSAIRPSGMHAPPKTFREVAIWPEPAAQCLRGALSRSVERVLTGLDPDLLTDTGPPRWPSDALRALFPSLGTAIRAQLELGRARLATGRVAEAAEAFRKAQQVDPEDGDVQAYLAEALLTLEMARELTPAADGTENAEGVGFLEPQLTPAQRAAAERLLDEERRTRQEIMGVLAIAGRDAESPPDLALRVLRAAVIDHDSTGARLARRRAGGPVELRVLYAPDGGVVAKYYFARGKRKPVLRENDVDSDGRSDEWIAYAKGLRSELWLDRKNAGEPDLHLVYAEDGRDVVRFEIDPERDGSPSRIFRYRAGVLHSEDRDTDGDGTLDRFETFDREGRVTHRAEDLDGDGQIDIRTFYENGSLSRREISNPSLVEQLLGE